MELHALIHVFIRFHKVRSLLLRDVDNCTYEYTIITRTCLRTASLCLWNHMYILRRADVCLWNHMYILRRADVCLWNHIYILWRAGVCLWNHMYILRRADVCLWNHMYIFPQKFGVNWARLSHYFDKHFSLIN
jgi:hypothetical protein